MSSPEEDKSKPSVLKVTDVASLRPEQWTSSANEALKLFITNSGEAVTFPPTFTYPLFGDAETIYGYRDLDVFLCFDHYTFLPFLNVKYAEKLRDDAEIVDVKETMLKHLPDLTVFKDEVKWVDAIEAEKKNGYAIPGVKVDSFEGEGGREFEIYRIDLKSESGFELHQRLQILVLLFIEAGSFIDAKDELWNLYVFYEKGKDQEPSIVGFTTAYNYWKYPGASKFDSEEQEVRIKISQFIILPVYQGQGLGPLFYTHLFNKWLQDDGIIEVVIEDPNESFDDLRDRADLKRLNEDPLFDFNEVTPSVDKAWIEKTRKRLKLEKRQFARLLEIILLYKLKQGGFPGVTKKNVRLFIKKRLYDKNKEGLATLDDNTKKDKLQTAYQALEEDYYRILGDLKLNIKRKSSGGGGDDDEQSSKRQKA
ncbi:Histone acetyltransferase type B catalytic subunit [Candida viswanathii]|uniref:Histone acetyltransferase type B catalytic subunit n=1 Tax=Candida viswanathii TaxID=5486 RepID=A0A367Y4D9_9ASCO|nr:Histone acetyltransferase type B catalytic subunit [Candida viswanathii]